jgi:hypothetical protein
MHPILGYSLFVNIFFHFNLIAVIGMKVKGVTLKNVLFPLEIFKSGQLWLLVPDDGSPHPNHPQIHQNIYGQ